MTDDKTPDVIAVAWYAPEDFDAVRLIDNDGGGLQATYDQWRQEAESQLAHARKLGVTVEKFMIKPDALKSWLRARNVKNTPEQRALYIHDLASAKYADKH